MKQSFKSKAINAVITAIVRTLFGWAEEWGNDAYFFLVIGDKKCSDVAWYNPFNISCQGAIAISSDPRSAATFADLNTGVELLVEDSLENEKFKAAYEKLQLPEDYHDGWYSYENIETNQTTDKRK